MTRWLKTDTLSNQNIATALAVGAYTADADRLILCQIFADQVAGGDAYSFYLTIQIGGSGSAYQMVPVTDTAEPTAGVTAIGAQSVLLFVRSGDVVTAYIDGLDTDITTPDTIVRWSELAALRPTTADRTLDVAATGTVANLDAKISDVKAKTDLIPASPAAVGSAMTLADAAIDAILDEVIEDGRTLRQLIRIGIAALVGDYVRSAGSVAFRDLADTKDRVVATMTSTERDVTALDGT